MWPTPPGEGQLASLWGSVCEEGPLFCNSSICSVASSWGRTTCHPPGNMGPTESPLSAQRRELPQVQTLESYSRISIHRNWNLLERGFTMCATLGTEALRETVATGGARRGDAFSFF